MKKVAHSQLKPNPGPQYVPTLNTFDVNLYFSLSSDNITSIYSQNFAIDISSNLIDNYIYIYFDDEKNVVNRVTDKFIKILFNKGITDNSLLNRNLNTVQHTLYVK